MGITKKRSLKHYWESTGKTWLLHTPNISKVMSRTRFLDILSMLHCHDNEDAAPRGRDGYNPLNKIQPQVDHFNKVFADKYRLDRDIAVDERMVGFKGRSSLKQYLANKKAHRWGANMWVLAESETGYTHQFSIYKGRNDAEPRTSNGQGYDVGMRLLEPHLHLNHHVTFDNWFTSPALVHDLHIRGTYSTGTVLVRRKGMPLSFKKLRLPKGQISIRRQGPVYAMLYSDRRQVTFLTTSGKMSRMERRRNSKGRLNHAPGVVHDYNRTMGGVDTGDMVIRNLEPDFRSLKLWKKILFHLLATAAVNAYIIYKTSFLIQKKKSHYQFHASIIKGLVNGYRQSPGRRGLINAVDERRLQGGHYIEFIPDGRRMKCQGCADRASGSLKKTRIGTWCRDCGVGLCVGCFRTFHLRR